MFAAPFVTLLALGATLELHVEGRAGVSAHQTDALAKELADALGRKTRLEIVAHAGPSERAAERVTVRVFGGITKLRVIADRTSVHGTELHVETELPGALEGRAEALDRFVEQLFPLPSLAPDPTAARVAVEAPGPPAAVWALEGASVVASGAAIALLVSAISVRSDLEGSPHTSPEVEDLHGTMVGRTVAAGALAGAAACFITLAWLVGR